MFQEVACDVCASPITSNLTGFGGSYAFAHDGEIVVQRVRRQGSTVRIWSTETVERLKHMELVPVGNLDSLCGSFFQGVSAIFVQDKSDHVCIGSSTGSVHVFMCSPVFQFSEVATLAGNGAPVLALQQASRPTAGVFFCSTADKALCVYCILNETCTLVCQSHLPTHVVALESLPGRVVCGVANGDISILCEVRTNGGWGTVQVGSASFTCCFNATIPLASAQDPRVQDTLDVVCTIAAHSRFLSGLHLHGAKPLLLSCGQDGTGAVWDLSRLEEKQVELKHSFLWNNSMQVGACWLDDHTGRAAVASYSCPIIRVYEVLPAD